MTAYIDNCVFKDNKAGGVNGATDGYGALAFYHSAKPATTKRITNCTFSGNFSRFGASTYGGAIHNRGLNNDDFLVSNCIFWGNGTMPVVTQMGVASISYSDIEGGTLTGFVDAGNNINADPLFSDTLLHIGKTSPCYNTGTNSFEPQATEDFEGSFTLKLLDANDPVEVSGSVTTPQTIQAGQPYSYTYPEDLFYDQDGTETLLISAGLENGSELPEWLAFDAASRTFSGTPENSDADSWGV